MIIDGYVARNKSLKRTNVLKSTVFLILPSKNVVFRTLKNLKKSVSQAILGWFESNLYQNVCFWVFWTHSNGQNLHLDDFEIFRLYHHAKCQIFGHFGFFRVKSFRFDQFLSSFFVFISLCIIQIKFMDQHFS